MASRSKLGPRGGKKSPSVCILIGGGVVLREKPKGHPGLGLSKSGKAPQKDRMGE